MHHHFIHPTKHDFKKIDVYERIRGNRQRKYARELGDRIHFRMIILITPSRACALLGVRYAEFEAHFLIKVET